MKSNDLTAPSIDGMQNYWWKRFVPELKRAFDKIKVESKVILEWWPAGSMVLIVPKTKEVNGGNNYCYKIITEIVDKIYEVSCNAKHYLG